MDVITSTRKRRYRRRVRCGIKVLAVEVNYHRLVEALLESTRLTDTQALDQNMVAAEAAAVLGEWAERWVGEK